ncbi:eukaryotic aspartyl protease family protein [Striga asiatica]|uniref:Eukaryotic aspartyl protease family protein n=1 Tax=Striga asiatica TaxID=4170 RepID=A0A5A7PT63_STRAF|nr:eukaryotic aspartyl protease family protein [Striga asiatica]
MQSLDALCLFSIIPINDSVRYGTTFCKGNLGRETFRFGKHQDEVVPNLAFGCAHNTSVEDLNGIFGLGNIPISFLSQYKASKFSYCFGNLNDPEYPYNMLAIGKDVRMWGARTPLTVEDKYYVNLVDIAIGHIWLKTSRHLFRRDKRKGEGGMLVDSGSTLTFLPQIVLTEFEKITRSVIKKLNLRLSPFSKKFRGYSTQCYIGEAIYLEPFPKVTLHFQNRAYMELTPDNVFFEADDNLFCLAILPSSLLRRNTTILGNVMQQNFNIAFDLEGEELAFNRMSCKSVEDYYGHDEL